MPGRPTTTRRALAALAVVAALGTLAPVQAETPLLDRSRFTVGAMLEVDIVGLAYGIRPELLWRPFAPDGAGNLRVAFGVLPGPEYLFLPLNLGWRWRWGAGWRVKPELGLGVERQTFVVGDAPPVGRTAFYLELGARYAVNERLNLGLQVAPDLSVFAEPGFGLATRVVASFDL